ncbi:hypothetical protein ACQ86B_09440 [Mycolicibacterium aichiense]|uniref:hypothetical protein n=1 Tax=Mycolicibacterium aichiense TaxID=1799 RepID=UPI003D665135
MIETTQETTPTARPGVPTWLNWFLALMTIPVAAAVMFVAFGAVLGIARCTDTAACPHMGPGEFWFGILAYGPPLVALLTIVASAFAANRRYGIVVPLLGLGLLLADAAILAITFRP